MAGIERTGVEISIQDSASGPARKIANEFDSVAKGAEGINSALDPRVLDEYNQKLNQIGESYSQLRNKQNGQDQQQSARTNQLRSAVGGVGSGLSSGLTQGSAGNVGGGAVSAAGGLSGLISGLGIPGMVVTAALGGAVITNKLADTYKSRAIPAQRLAGLTDQLSTDFGENTNALRAAMASTVESVSKYGKTYEEGIAAQETFFRAGGSNFDASRAGAYSMAGRGDMSRLSAFSGLTQRYGQTGALDAIEGLKRTQGLGNAQYEELMGGVQDIFSSYLSQGIIKDIPEITKGLGFFGQAGATFQGGLGAQKMMQMNQSVAGAAGLQSQEDFISWRAAQSLTGGGGVWETRKELEKGMTPEFFKSLMSQYEELGYDKEMTMMALQDRFSGLSSTAVENLYGLKGKDITAADIEGVEEGTGESVVTGVISDEQRIVQTLNEMFGQGALDAKAKVLGLSGGALEGLQKFLSGETGMGMDVESIHVQDFVVEGRTRGIGMGDSMGFSGIMEALTTTKRGITIKSSLADDIAEAKERGLTEDQIAEGIGPAVKRATQGDSPGGSKITASEMSDISVILADVLEAIKDTAVAVREDVDLEDNSSQRGQTK